MIDRLEGSDDFCRELARAPVDRALVVCAALLEPALVLAERFDAEKGTLFARALREELREVYASFSAGRLLARWGAISMNIDTSAAAVMDALYHSVAPPSWFVECACACVAEFARMEAAEQTIQAAAVPIVNALNELLYALVDEDVGRSVMPRDAAVSTSRHVLLEEEQASRNQLLQLLHGGTGGEFFASNCAAVRQGVAERVRSLAMQISNPDP